MVGKNKNTCFYITDTKWKTMNISEKKNFSILINYSILVSVKNNTVLNF